jgi:hypothetical protein
LEDGDENAADDTEDEGMALHGRKKYIAGRPLTPLRSRRGTSIPKDRGGGAGEALEV